MYIRYHMAYVHYVFILSLFPQDENVASADDDDLEETSTFDINVCILILYTLRRQLAVQTSDCKLHINW